MRGDVVSAARVAAGAVALVGLFLAVSAVPAVALSPVPAAEPDPRDAAAPSVWLGGFRPLPVPTSGRDWVVAARRTGGLRVGGLAVGAGAAGGSGRLVARRAGGRGAALDGAAPADRVGLTAARYCLLRWLSAAGRTFGS